MTTETSIIVLMLIGGAILTVMNIQIQYKFIQIHRKITEINNKLK